MQQRRLLMLLFIFLILTGVGLAWSVVLLSHTTVAIPGTASSSDSSAITRTAVSQANAAAVAAALTQTESSDRSTKSVASTLASRPSEVPTEVPTGTISEPLVTVFAGATPTITYTSQPATITPTTVTSLASEVSELTATTRVLDIEASLSALTATVAPTTASGTPISKKFAIIDAAGNKLGDGEVRVYAPSRININETGGIRVEVNVNSPVPAGTYEPPDTPTPNLSTPKPTPSPVPLSDRQFVEVREYMGADLRGVDYDYFRVEPDVQNPIHHIKQNAINVWRWTLRPRGKDAIGARKLEIFLYLPTIGTDGKASIKEANSIPIDIEVNSPNAVGDFVENVGGQLAALAGLIATIGGAIGTLYTGYHFIVQRRKNQHREQST